MYNKIKVDCTKSRAGLEEWFSDQPQEIIGKINGSVREFLMDKPQRIFAHEYYEEQEVVV